MKIEKWAVKIKSRILLNNIRQNDLADKLGITKSYLSMLFKGRRISDNYNYTTMNKAIDEIIAEKETYYDRDTDILYPIEEVYSKRCKNSTFARKIKDYKGVEIIADSARPDNIAEMNDWGFDVVGAVKRWGNNKGRDYCWEWLRQCNKIIVDRARTPHLADELTKLEFELLKDGTFSSEYPKLNEDCICALIYGLNRVIRESRREDLYADEDESEEDYEE